MRLRELKKAMPKTPMQMLLRGQNLLGYRHYADDVVDKFVERSVANGMSVFRVFDALNDPRNMQAALQAVKTRRARTRYFELHHQPCSYPTNVVGCNRAIIGNWRGFVGDQRYVGHFNPNGSL